MYLFKRYILFVVSAVMAFCSITAQDIVSDDVLSTNVSYARESEIGESEVRVPEMRVSLITCTVGADLYTKFGHTAIRVCIDDSYDWVFNYGCFNYRADNFIWKFVLGQTDYVLEAEPYRFFLERYRSMGVGVTEQVLDITQDEAQTMRALLEENIRPENQEYRYSWLYDNCTERARDMIEKAIGGMVDYERFSSDTYTVRGLLHSCLRNDEWTDWGISLLLGSEIDLPADKRLQMFLPFIFMREMSEASVIRIRTGKQSMVRETVELNTPTQVPQLAKGEAGQSPIGGWGAAALFSSPTIVMLLLLIAVIAMTIYDMRRKRQTIWLDVTLTTMQGIAGCLIAFLFFFSEHPAVGSNWLVMMFNPIALGYAVWMVRCDRKKRRNMIAVANVTVLTAFLPTMWLCTQTFCPATYLVVLILLVRAVAQMKLCR